MKRFTIAEIAEISGGKVLCGDGSFLVSGYAIDSRETEPGNVFFALKGLVTDGHRFIPQVIERGCNCLVISDETMLPENIEGLNVVVVENPLKSLQALGVHYLNSLPLKKKIGITGSVGKTSTRDMTYYVASTKYKTAKNKKNYNSSTGIPLTILEFPEDTEIAILEMGMESLGEIEELAELVRPDIAIITLVAEVHIENLGTIENILKAKMEITSQFNENSVLIVNTDCDMLKKEKVSGDYKVVSIGSTGEEDYLVKDVEDYGAEGIGFKLVSGESEYEISLPIAGAHNAKNASLAIAVGELIGISPEEAAEGLQNTELTGRRLNFKKHKGMQIIDDCYNACEDSIKSAINTLMATEGGRKVAVLGDIFALGSIAERVHRSVGCYVAEKNVDFLVAIGDNAIFYAEEAKKALGEERVKYFDKKEDFIKVKDDIIKDGDVILIKASLGMRLDTVTQSILEG